MNHISFVHWPHSAASFHTHTLTCAHTFMLCTCRCANMGVWVCVCVWADSVTCLGPGGVYKSLIFTTHWSNGHSALSRLKDWWVSISKHMSWYEILIHQAIFYHGWCQMCVLYILYVCEFRSCVPACCDEGDHADLCCGVFALLLDAACGLHEGGWHIQPGYLYIMWQSMGMLKVWRILM